MRMSYGYRRMKLNINRRFNKNYNHKRIYRLMKVVKIESLIRRKRKNTGIQIQIILLIICSIVN